jgi:hypothetical protein
MLPNNYHVTRRHISKDITSNTERSVYQTVGRAPLDFAKNLEVLVCKQIRFISSSIIAELESLSIY